MKGGSIFGGLIEMAVDPSLPPETIMVNGKVLQLHGGLRRVEPFAPPHFRFGDVIRYRPLGREVFMVLTTDPENGDLLDLLALDDGHVYRDCKDPAMWEIVE